MGGNWGKQKKVKIKKETLAQTTAIMKQLRDRLAIMEKESIMTIIKERERCADIARDFDTIGDPTEWPMKISERILMGDQHGYRNEENPSV